MSYVRINRENLSASMEAASNLIACLENAGTYASTFQTDAKKVSGGWASNSTIINNWVSYLKRTEPGTYSSGVDANNQTIWLTSALNTAAKSLISSKVTSSTGFNNAVDTVYSLEYKDNAQKLYDSLEKIQLAIEAFEEYGRSVSLSDTLETSKLADGFSFETSQMQIGNETVNIDTLVYTDPDTGKTYVYAEHINAFYTTVGMMGNGAICAAAANNNSDEAINSYLKTAGEFVNSSFSKGYFSVASQTGIAGMYEDAFPGRTYDAAKVKEEYMSAFAEFDPTALQSSLGNQTNSDMCLTMGLAGAFVAAFDGINKNALKYEDDEDEKTTDEPSGEPATNPTTGGSPGGGGGTPDSGGGDTQVENPETPDEETTEEVPEEEVHEEYEEQYEEIEEVIEEADEDLEDIKEDFEETDTEEIQEENKEITEEFIDDQAKDDYFDKVNENDGDNSLREEIAEKTESFENRFIENQNNPTDAGTQEIKAELKELGYDDAAIDKIMSGDPTVAKNAFKVGVQDQEMAKIANELAEKAGIEDFDTSYDDSQSYDSLHDGTVNVELTDHDRFIDTLRPESGSNAETPKVVTEYDEYQQAETDFVEAKESYEEIYT